MHLIYFCYLLIEGERYYLRLLLNHVRGPKSFDDLLVVDDVACSTFKDSAMKRGLLESDNNVSECMIEAVAFQMPSELRRLFAILLVYCEPADVRKLWNDHFEAMSDDFRKMHEGSLQIQISSTLKSIDFYLQSMGKDIKKYDLPKMLNDHSDLEASNLREITNELAIEIPKEDLEAIDQLNPE